MPSCAAWGKTGLLSTVLDLKKSSLQYALDYVGLKFANLLIRVQHV